MTWPERWEWMIRSLTARIGAMEKWVDQDREQSQFRLGRIAEAKQTLNWIEEMTPPAGKRDLAGERRALRRRDSLLYAYIADCEAQLALERVGETVLVRGLEGEIDEIVGLAMIGYRQMRHTAWLAAQGWPGWNFPTDTKQHAQTTPSTDEPD